MTEFDAVDPYFFVEAGLSNVHRKSRRSAMGKKIPPFLIPIFVPQKTEQFGVMEY
jgi:hypothetical protein